MPSSQGLSSNATQRVKLERGEGFFDALRRREFGRLDASAHAYLDYGGSGLYPESLIQWHQEELVSHVLGNPHSENPTSAESTRLVEAARQAVLSFFDADSDLYTVVFTSNASAAAKLVAESFPFGPGRGLVLAADNHNSVNGIREYARSAGATTDVIGLRDDLRLNDPSAWFGSTAAAGSRGLFAYPAQSNFSGIQHPGWLIGAAQTAGYRVFLDAAAHVPTRLFSLRESQPDFVGISFYKMFGYPTGVGALIARTDALAELRRPWFAGGTVAWASVQSGTHQLTNGPEAFEDGTPNFLAMAAIPRGLDFLRREVGMHRLAARISSLTGRLLQGLEGLERDTGSSRVEVYGATNLEDRGGTVAFNLMDDAGRAVPYERVEARAGEAGISIRGGCFCNPGAAEFAFDFHADRLEQCLQAQPRGSFTVERLRRCLGGAPVGAVRASLGVASTEADVDRLLECLYESSRSLAPGRAAHRRTLGRPVLSR